MNMQALLDPCPISDLQSDPQMSESAPTESQFMSIVGAGRCPLLGCHGSLEPIKPNQTKQPTAG